MGLLQLIPIPERPYVVVTMDFITELPLSNGFDCILVIIDKLTKFVTLVPTTTGVNEEQMAELLFVHIVIKYRLLRQIITD